MGKIINFEDASIDAQIGNLLEELDKYQKEIEEIRALLETAEEELETELARRSVPLRLVQ